MLILDKVYTQFSRLFLCKTQTLKMLRILNLKSTCLDKQASTQNLPRVELENQDFYTECHLFFQ